jgi:hypothetical protein
VAQELPMFLSNGRIGCVSEGATSRASPTIPVTSLNFPVLQHIFLDDLSKELRKKPLRHSDFLL